MKKSRIFKPIERSRIMVRSIWVGCGLGALAIATAVAVAPHSPQVTREIVVEQLHIEGSKPLSAADQRGFMSEERIRPGETIGSLLPRLGVKTPETLNYFRTAPEVRAIGEQLAPGKSVFAKVTEEGELLGLHFPLNDREHSLVIERSNGEMSVKKSTEVLERVVIAKSGEIRNSLFATTDAIGIPDAITIQMVELFGGEIDFHRDLRKGDRFVVTYEVDYLRGQPVRSGRVLGAEFINDGKTHRAIWFADSSGSGYYTEDGKPLKKEFLRSPLEFSRITSGFSRRFHPILNEWRAHNGVDYAAPSGTKVRATGDSIVDFIGFQKGYGNIVILKHSGQHTTAYAHLKGFAKGLRKGSRIHQGDTIGYVGSTGWATGPHLHYEFRVGGRATNPLSTKLATGTPLSPDKLAHFQKQTHPIQQQIEMLSMADIVHLE